MWLLVLSSLAVVSAALTISAEYHGPKQAVYISKPLAIIFIILITLTPKYPVAPIYRYLIVAGLICSLVGDIFLIRPQDRFVHGLVSFLVAHLFYIAAFTFEAGLRVLSYGAGPPLFIYAGLLLWWLWPKLGNMKGPVIIYMFVIALMAWTSIGKYLATGQAGSFLAALGAVLFAASDSILAVKRFRGSFRSAELLILATYFTAQYLIALST